MNGPPDDVEGECNARLYIGDDYGDNHATMRCSLHAGHEGSHQETWRNGACRLEWDGDDRGSPEESEEDHGT